MTLTTLSAYLDDFLAMKRVRAEVDARSGPDRRQLRYTERLLRSFLEFWQASGLTRPGGGGLLHDAPGPASELHEHRCHVSAIAPPCRHPGGARTASTVTPFLRHTFAVNRLTRWHRERRNVQEWLPHLSVYLGHLSPANTYWYISGTPALLQTAAGLVDAPGQEGGGQ